MVSDGELIPRQVELRSPADDTLPAMAHEVNAGERCGKLEWTDPDGDDPISIEIVQNVQTVSIIDPNQEDFTYTANSDYEGDDTLCGVFAVKHAVQQQQLPFS